MNIDYNFIEKDLIRKGASVYEAKTAVRLLKELGLAGTIRKERARRPEDQKDRAREEEYRSRYSTAEQNKLRWKQRIREAQAALEEEDNYRLPF